MIRIILSLHVLFFTVVCSVTADSKVENKEVKSKSLNIVATTAMIGDIAKEVADSKDQVKILIGSGVDPHLFKPTRDDIINLTGADVVFYNGLLLEGRMTDALIRVAGSGKKVVPVTEMLEGEFLIEVETFPGHYDPHVWMDPLGWIQAVNVIRNTLSENNPEKRSIYYDNAARYTAELYRLNDYAQTVLGSVPESSRILVTAHDAFNYFGRRYGYEVVGIQGLSTESEAGIKDIERIVDILVTRKIKGVFVESTVSDRNVKALIAGAKAKGHDVNIGGTLFSDAMGQSGTYTGTYIGMIDHNVTTIATALGGKTDALGLNGRLEKKS